MKRWIYTCDKCGKEIPDAERWAMRLADPEDLERNEFLFGAKYEFDLCGKCAEQLVEHIAGRESMERPLTSEEAFEVGRETGNAMVRAIFGEPPEETAVQQDDDRKETTKDPAELQQDKDAEEQQEPDKSKEVQQGKKKPGRPRKQPQEIDTGKQPQEIDIGKVMALYDANWIPTEIAADMHASTEEVQDVIKKELLKRGK